MYIYDNLPKHECDALRTYLTWYGGRDECGDCGASADLPHFLRFWDKNKAAIYKMFGNQFIVKQPISFEKDSDELEEEMYRVLDRDSGAQSFIRTYVDRIYKLGFCDFEIEENLRHFVFGTADQVANIYNWDAFTIPASKTVDNRPLQVNKGCKLIKMLGKIAKAIGVDTKGYKCPDCGRVFYYDPDSATYCPRCGRNYDLQEVDLFECFRQAHSRALNSKLVRGNLCLSIHPLDYITMSDNTYNWDSCMNWMGYPGDFRLGTIECMNSPYIVVAYVESEGEQLHFGDDKVWNSKRWRELFIVTPELILGNRQYPYDHDLLRGTALTMLRKYVETDPNYGPYEDESVNIINHKRNYFGDRSFRVELNFDYMYNDIYDDRLGLIAPHRIRNDWINYNLSGPAVCTGCGSIIYYGDDADPRSTVCRECSGDWQCDCCGEWCNGDSYEYHGHTYCYHCYHYELKECEVCGERHEPDDVSTVYVELTEIPKSNRLEAENWSYVIDVCTDCLDSPNFERLFGEPFWRVDNWGRNRLCVRVKNFSDDGIESGGLSQYTKEMFREIRAAGSDEAELKVIEKYFL